MLNQKPHFEHSDVEQSLWKDITENIIFRKDGVYLPFFENFYPFVKENFLKNVDEMIVFAEKKNKDFNGEEINFKTSYYSMNINVNYFVVIQRLKEAQILLSS